MGFEGFGLGDVKLREGRNEWVRPGIHDLRIKSVREKSGDLFIDFVVEATRDRSEKSKTVPYEGKEVSYKFGMAGTGRKPQMAKADFKMLLAAVVASCGRDINKIAAGQWDQVANNMVLGKGIGVLVRATARNLTDESGNEIDYTVVDWSGIRGGADVPALFEGFGFGGTKPATAPAAAGAPRPGARPAVQAVDPAKRAEVLEGLREWHAAGLDRDAVTDASGEYAPWAAGLVGSSAYAALVAEVYG